MEAPGELDAFFKSAVWLQGLSIHVTTVFTPLRAYEDFAATVGDRLGEESKMSLVELACSIFSHLLWNTKVKVLAELYLYKRSLLTSRNI